jgi:hypothetical protein
VQVFIAGFCANLSLTTTVASLVCPANRNSRRLAPRDLERIRCFPHVRIVSNDKVVQR